jgi:hypothetical protein
MTDFSSETRKQERLAQLVEDFNAEFDMQTLREIWQLTRNLSQKPEPAPAVVEVATPMEVRQVVSHESFYCWTLEETVEAPAKPDAAPQLRRRDPSFADLQDLEPQRASTRRGSAHVSSPKKRAHNAPPYGVLACFGIGGPK